MKISILVMVLGLIASAFGDPHWSSPYNISRIFVNQTQISTQDPTLGGTICYVELIEGHPRAFWLNDKTEHMYQLILQAKSENKQVIVWGDPSTSIGWVGYGNTVMTNARPMSGVALAQ